MKNSRSALLLSALLVTTSSIALGDGSGKYSKYNYTYTENDGVVITLFKPFLPRDDTILIGAMLEMVNKVYGKHQISNLKPSIVNKGGRSLIQFQGKGYNYLFLIVKQDSGEVNGLSMWRERA